MTGQVSQRADVAVVGGGVVGAAIAWRLGRDGRDVVWLSGPAGAGSASAASGAMLAVHSEVTAHQDGGTRDLEISARSQGMARWTDWLPDIGAASGLDVPVSHGLYVVGSGVADAQSMSAIRAATTAAGFTSVTVDPAEVPGLCPDRGAEPADAIYLPGEASLDSAVLLSAMRGAVSTLPGVRCNAHDVTRIDLQEGQVALSTPAGVVCAREIVLAAGVSTSALLRASGLAEAIPPLLAGRGASMMVRGAVPTATCIRTPNRAFACGWHLVARAGGQKTYLGATNRLTTQPDADALPTLSELNDLIGGCVRELNSRLRRAELVSSGVGFRPVTADRLPLVGRTDRPGLLVATGTWRNGIVLAPMVADLISQEVAEPGATAKHPFAPTRVLQPLPLDNATITRAADGMVGAWLASGILAPGRAAELSAFLAATLTSHLAGAGPDRAVARLLERAPMEEVLPLVYELLARGER